MCPVASTQGSSISPDAFQTGKNRNHPNGNTGSSSSHKNTLIG
jgi:hypothetical protein